VRCPVLAFFGEEDQNLPAKKSAALFEQYLTEAGNRDFKIVVFPGVGHSLGGFLPAYWETLSDWLNQRARLADWTGERGSLTGPASAAR
jgi:dipeptidyl aminopeptidase/acylaminoacyl peptidase